MIAVNVYGAAGADRAGKTAGQAQMASANTTFAVRLIDRRTGAAHRINGHPLTLFSRDPATATAELLAGRDPAVWEVQVEPLTQGARK